MLDYLITLTDGTERKIGRARLWHDTNRNLYVFSRFARDGSLYVVGSFADHLVTEVLAGDGAAGQMTGAWTDDESAWVDGDRGDHIDHEIDPNANVNWGMHVQ